MYCTELCQEREKVLSENSLMPFPFFLHDSCDNFYKSAIYVNNLNLNGLHVFMHACMSVFNIYYIYIYSI